MQTLLGASLKHKKQALPPHTLPDNIRCLHPHTEKHNIFHHCVFLHRPSKMCPAEYLTSPLENHLLVFPPAFAVRAEAAPDHPQVISVWNAVACVHICAAAPAPPALRRASECVISLKAPENPLEPSPASLAGQWDTARAFGHMGKNPQNLPKIIISSSKLRTHLRSVYHF